jgi:hypothetical protein
MLPLIGALAGGAIGGGALLPIALGSGLGSFAETGDLGRGIMTGIGAAATGGMYGNFAGSGPLAQFAPFIKTAGGALGAAAMNPEEEEELRLRSRNKTLNVQPYTRTPRGLTSRPVSTNIKGYEEGGIASIGKNDKQVIIDAVRALRKQVDKETAIKALSEFVARFDREALIDLAQKVQKNMVARTDRPSEGMLRGAGDGMSDMIPANLEGQEDILLSQNEYIVPADVVSGLGNGSSDAGAEVLDSMSDKVRTARTGTTKQAPEINASQMVPV